MGKLIWEVQKLFLAPKHSEGKGCPTNQPTRGLERPFRYLDIDHKIKNIDQNGEYRPMVYNIDHLAGGRPDVTPYSPLTQSIKTFKSPFSSMSTYPWPVGHILYQSTLNILDRELCCWYLGRFAYANNFACERDQKTHPFYPSAKRHSIPKQRKADSGNLYPFDSKIEINLSRMNFQKIIF